MEEKFPTRKQRARVITLNMYMATEPIRRHDKISIVNNLQFEESVSVNETKRNRSLSTTPTREHRLLRRRNNKS